jgi:hypothetical protein
MFQHSPLQQFILFVYASGASIFPVSIVTEVPNIETFVNFFGTKCISFGAQNSK